VASAVRVCVCVCVCECGACSHSRGNSSFSSTTPRGTEAEPQNRSCFLCLSRRKAKVKVTNIFRTTTENRDFDAGYIHTLGYACFHSGTHVRGRVLRSTLLLFALRKQQGARPARHPHVAGVCMRMPAASWQLAGSSEDRKISEKLFSGPRVHRTKAGGGLNPSQARSARNAMSALPAPKCYAGACVHVAQTPIGIARTRCVPASPPIRAGERALKPRNRVRIHPLPSPHVTSARRCAVPVRGSPSPNEWCPQAWARARATACR